MVDWRSWTMGNCREGNWPFLFNKKKGRKNRRPKGLGCKHYIMNLCKMTFLPRLLGIWCIGTIEIIRLDNVHPLTIFPPNWNHCLCRYSRTHITLQYHQYHQHTPIKNLNRSWTKSSWKWKNAGEMRSSKAKVTVAEILPVVVWPSITLCSYEKKNVPETETLREMWSLVEFNPRL